MIAGKPMLDDASVYEKQIAALPAEVREQITFQPSYLPLEEVPKVLTHVHASAMPYTEGWNSGAIATAFGYGKPVIATNIGGFPEVIHDGENGFLVPPGDPAAIAEAFVKLFSDQQLLETVSAGARKSGEAESLGTSSPGRSKSTTPLDHSDRKSDARRRSGRELRRWRDHPIRPDAEWLRGGRGRLRRARRGAGKAIDRSVVAR